jgi:oligopeptide/dipeptide ABC transporter ATP-binding protein
MLYTVLAERFGDMNEVILEAERLTVARRSSAGVFNLVDDISFAVHKGEMFALIGESAAGKTTIALALTNLFHRSSNLAIDGKVIFLGQNLAGASESALSRIRANSIRHIFQEPGLSLNPVARIRKQFSLAQSAVTHSTGRAGALEQAEWLKRVGIQNPSVVLNSYPHQLSGGTLQRILIAMAMAGHPQLLLADEPTSSLDAHLRDQIIRLLESFRKEYGTSVVLITHDLNIAENHADTIAVLYAGQIVEIGGRESFFESPMHPYSQTLLDGAVKNSANWKKDSAATQYHPSARPSGCRFRIRCPKARSECSTVTPPLRRINDTTEIRCLFWK